MSIAIQADSSLPQGYILVNGTAATTVRQDGTIVASSLSATNVSTTGIRSTGTIVGNLSGIASQATTLVTASASNAPVYGCRAWVNFDATRNAAGNPDTSNTNRFIRSSGNVSYVLRTGIGTHTIVFATPMADANYAMQITMGDPGGYATSPPMINGISSLSASILTYSGQGGVGSSFFDRVINCVTVFGN